MVRRGRRAKLLKAQVMRIRLEHRRGRTMRALAAEYGVSVNTVWSVVNGYTHKTVVEVE